MDASSDLLRFLYIGTNQPFTLYRNDPIDKEKHGKLLEFLQASITSEILINIVKKSMQSNTLPRNDEAIFVLAYALLKSYKENPEQLHSIYESIPEMISDCTDLFLLLNFMEELSGKKLSFGHGLKSLVKAWYGKHTAEQLVDIICKNRKMHGFSHKRILIASHIVLKDKEKNEILKTAYSTTLTKSVDKLKTENSDTLDEISNSFGRMTIICQMKNSSSDKQLIEYMKNHKFPIELLPSKFIRSGEVWGALLPQMTYKEILNILLILNDCRLLRDTESFSKKYTYALGNMPAVADSKVHPVEIITKMRLFEKKQRYMGFVKENHHTDNMQLLQTMETNVSVTKKLMEGLNHSMNNYPKIGVRFYITLDLKAAGSRNKRVFGNRFLTSTEAMVLLALTIYKREKDVTIVTFTDMPKILKPVEFKKDMTFEEALAYCNEIKYEKTHCDITLPIKTAIALKMKVDVFMTITDSLVKINPKRKPPIEPLFEYRKHMNMKMTRHIFVNLTRHTQDLIFENRKSTKGILEIGGFSKETPKIIEAFSKNLFS